MNKNVLNSIAKQLRMSAEDLTAKLNSEDSEELTFDFKTYTDQELSSRIRNDENYLSPEDKTTLVESVRNGALEVWAKRYNDANEIGLSGQDRKSIDKIIETVKGKIEGKPNEELQRRIDAFTTEKQQMVTAHQSALEEANKKYTALLQEKQGMQLKDRLRAELGDGEYKHSASDLMDLFSLKHSVNFEDGKVSVSKNGEVIKNMTTFDPIPVEKVFKNWIIENKYEKQAAGRGLGNSGQGSGVQPTNIDELAAQFEAEGKSLNGKEFDSAVAKMVAANATK